MYVSLHHPHYAGVLKVVCLHVAAAPWTRVPADAASTCDLAATSPVMCVCSTYCRYCPHYVDREVCTPHLRGYNSVRVRVNYGTYVRRE